MRRVDSILFAALFIFAFASVHETAYAASASIAGVYPAAEVPIDVPVSFAIVSNGFTNPTYYLVDSFPGGATTVNIIDNAGDFQWTPNIDDIGTHTLTITVSDADENTATASQTITVDGTASLTINSILPGTSVTIGVPFSFLVSPYGLLTPTYSLGDSFRNSSLQSYDISSSGAVTWTPIGQDVGTHTITVTAKDRYDHTATVSKDIVVLPTPTVSFLKITPGTSVNAGNTLSFVATSTGFIDQTYTINDTWSGVGTSTVAIDASGKATWTPQYNDIGVHHFQVTVTDSTGRTLTSTLAITVLPPSGTPVVPAATTTPTQKQTTTPPPAPPPVSTHPSTPTQSKTLNTAPVSSVSQPIPTEAPVPVVVTDEFASSSAPGLLVASDTPLPAIPPTPSFGEFIVGSIVGFFTSLFKLF